MLLQAPDSIGSDVTGALRRASAGRHRVIDQRPGRRHTPIMSPMPRRQFLTATAGALAGSGSLNFLSGLPRVAAEEAALPPAMVKFSPEMEPLVRLLAEF